MSNNKIELNLMDLSEEIIMTVDSGKMNTNGYTENKNGEEIKHIFRTNVVETKEILANEYKVVSDNVTYSVGDPAHDIREEDHLETQKDTNMHFICTLKMIANLLKKAGYSKKGAKIALGINVPVKQYLIEEERGKFIKLYKGHHEIFVEEEFYSFEITTVEPYFEGSGFLYNNLMKYKNRRIILVDNGGHESTYVEVNNLAPQTGANSLQTGIHRLINDILAKHSSYGMTRDQVLDILDKNGKTHSTPQIEKDFNICIKDHVQGIYTRLNSVKRAAITDFAFTGGATSVYRPYLEEFFPHREFSEDGLYDNVSGNYKKMKLKRSAKRA